MKKCFVITPIGNDDSDTRKKADKVLKHIIEPVCKKCGFETIRVDKLNQSDNIAQTIVDYLLKAELVIADLTEHNPNAFYEIGYRACTNKPMIHIKDKDETIPFDVSIIRTIDYDLTDLDVVEDVKKRLEQTIKSFNITEGEDMTSSLDEISVNAKDSFNISQILTLLYSIQDQITRLTQEIKNKDNETIQAIIKANQPNTSPEYLGMELMKSVLPELIKNPNSINMLKELSDSKNENN